MEQFLVKRQGLAGTGPIQIIYAFGASVCRRNRTGHRLSPGCPCFKVLLGLVVDRTVRHGRVRLPAGDRRTLRTHRAFPDGRHYFLCLPGGLRPPGQGAVFFFDLQVGQTTHGLGCQGRTRRLLQKALITQHRFIDPAFNFLFFDFDLHMAQPGNRILVAGRLTGYQHCLQRQYEKPDSAH